MFLIRMCWCVPFERAKQFTNAFVKCHSISLTFIAKKYAPPSNSARVFLLVLTRIICTKF